MQNIDLHTLRVLEEIHRTGSLSRTALRLGLTQPAISIALAKLREHFGDALFVRVGHTMRPTPQAEGLMPSVRSAISLLEQTLNYRTAFDAATTDRLYRVAMTDVGQIVILPRLLEVLARQAASARLEIVNIHERTPRLLEDGELDLALGFVPQMPPGFYQQALFHEHFACLVRSDHPRITHRLSREQFESESHVVIQTSGTGHLIIDRTLEELGVRRRVAVSIPSFLGLATLIGSTDHLCTLPHRAASVMSRSGLVTAWPLPFEIPDYTVKQYWHERQARDPGNRWLRRVMVELFCPPPTQAAS